MKLDITFRLKHLPNRVANDWLIIDQQNDDSIRGPWGFRACGGIRWDHGIF